MAEYTFDTTSPLFHSGSFLIFCDWDIFESVFYNDLQQHWESADPALTSLLKFLDKHSSGPRFFEAKGRVFKRVGKRWLRAGIGKEFWSEDHKHIWESEDIDVEGMLTWPEDEFSLRWTVAALLKLIQPHAKKLWEERSRFQADQAAKVEEEAEADEEERPRKRPRLLELPVRQRAV
jgi:hypothetical protein